jgi:hypothetical protein
MHTFLWRPHSPAESASAAGRDTGGRLAGRHRRASAVGGSANSDGVASLPTGGSTGTAVRHWWAAGDYFGGGGRRSDSPVGSGGGGCGGDRPTAGSGRAAAGSGGGGGGGFPGHVVAAKRRLSVCVPPSHWEGKAGKLPWLRSMLSGMRSSSPGVTAPGDGEGGELRGSALAPT